MNILFIHESNDIYTKTLLDILQNQMLQILQKLDIELSITSLAISSNLSNSENEEIENQIKSKEKGKVVMINTIKSSIFKNLIMKNRKRSVVAEEILLNSDSQVNNVLIVYPGYNDLYNNKEIEVSKPGKLKLVYECEGKEEEILVERINSFENVVGIGGFISKESIDLLARTCFEISKNRECRYSICLLSSLTVDNIYKSIFDRYFSYERYSNIEYSHIDTNNIEDMMEFYYKLKSEKSSSSSIISCNTYNGEVLSNLFLNTKLLISNEDKEGNNIFEAFLKNDTFDKRVSSCLIIFFTITRSIRLMLNITDVYLYFTNLLETCVISQYNLIKNNVFDEENFIHSVFDEFLVKCSEQNRIKF